MSAGVAPSGGDCEAHEVGGEVAHAVVKASHACGVAAGDLMEAGAVDLGGGGGRESVGSVVGFVRAGVAQRMSGAEVCEALVDV